MPEASPVTATEWVDASVRTALELGASDIHFEPGRQWFHIRMRCDGLLHRYRETGMAQAAAIVARLKILGNLDIAEKRLPQDGRCTLNGTSGPVDARISTLPALYGEKVVLRLLTADTAGLTLASLNMPDVQCRLYRDALQQPQGLILVTGPTGAGKTTSLYAGLQEKNAPSLCIATVEDPIEMALTGATQVAVHPSLGLTFAHCLRALLRQDPDVIMIGEIRDRETASIALHAAQTGHLVLSSLHTSSATEAVVRLRSLGIEPAELAHAVNLIMGQRLVRRLCRHCSRETGRPGPGCPECLGGYRGRTGVYEQLVSEPAPEGQNRRLTAPLSTLRTSGEALVSAGVTSMAELDRVIGRHAGAHASV